MSQPTLELVPESFKNTGIYGMVGEKVTDRFGMTGIVVHWDEYAGFCRILLPDGRIVRRYTVNTRLAF